MVVKLVKSQESNSCEKAMSILYTITLIKMGFGEGRKTTIAKEETKLICK